MFTSKVDKQTAQEVNALLIAGAKLTEVAAKTGLSYPKVHYFRKKLVKAGALQPLNKTTRSRRATRRTMTKRATTKQTIVNPSSTNQAFKLMVNGTTLDLNNVKSVYVSPGVVDIKY